MTDVFLGNSSVICFCFYTFLFCFAEVLGAASFLSHPEMWLYKVQIGRLNTKFSEDVIQLRAQSWKCVMPPMCSGSITCFSRCFWLCERCHAEACRLVAARNGERSGSFGSRRPPPQIGLCRGWVGGREGGMGGDRGKEEIRLGPGKRVALVAKAPSEFFSVSCLTKQCSCFTEKRDMPTISLHAIGRRLTGH